MRCRLRSRPAAALGRVRGFAPAAVSALCSAMWRGRKMRKVGALADLRIAIDEAAGLLDDAVDHRQAEPGALADFLGGEERLEDLLDHLGRNAACRCLDLDQT